MHQYRYIFFSIVLLLFTSPSLHSRKLKAVPLFPPSLHIPLGLVNQTKEEASYLKLHKCRDAGEVYSASYLITKEHLINQFTDYNLTWVNCEMGSFIMMNQRFDPNKNVNGTLIQSLDVLDFSVIHLSAYERLQRRWSKSITMSMNIANKEIYKNKNENAVKLSLKFDPNDIEPVLQVVKRLKENALRIRSVDVGYDSSMLSDLNRTVAIMPFLANENGAGHSKLGNRLHYLQACFWSLYIEFPNIVVFVKNLKDEQFARNVSGLPFYDVIRIDNLPKSASLPVSSVQQAKSRLIDGRWDFDYIFFTESDQILMMRSREEIFQHLKLYPRRLIVPHRLMPYPEVVLKFHHKRNISQNMNNDWMDMSCCLQRNNCRERKGWLKVNDPNVPVLNIFGLQVALGNSNFHEETYKTCVLNPFNNNATCP